ncbi:MAG: histidinol-phosphate transaminase [Zymomonas mobilis subsp. pomaceae]|uniref:Histidinol-phosphate aminotransferase n=1 Tax=Zymomonas mobilis subsp. pomaceae (strain ATCC 29192 / DSM 22645 / JCM 10191 / CCUG 17912 / NBRC 13757 / NCIMB 11200 / NRRL B-4491 / Barker I) TaxID=579138 RepID=F8ESB3_ZYMMT|nr:histidinol-phosphate transaminase [Zymomonas mobilis]AEI37688.1 histidinol-phosphate aminotransferase [Zymomonas mobilis subsp. pomaceae ATCC 29192]MDX5949055.1 histidinol-phosphate transaminase [Zymomonas mobilis subsp. pomaceae]GEB88860.1 histidinol-phosphate aminotransferase [Zymomonas mobilis subsp. pomaceae]
MTSPELRPKSWIDSIAPYIPGSSKTLDGRPAIKLSSNENPLGTSQKAQEAYINAVSSLYRYPDSEATELREAIGACYKLDPARIIHGTGSDEILHLAAGAYAGQDDEVLYPRYSFSVYPLAARRVGATPVEAPDDDYRCSVDALLAAVTPRTRVVFIANPNNPTGTWISQAEVERLYNGLPRNCLLVVDQAYAEYLDPECDDGALALAKNVRNVLVTRTFSKIYGLAAERIGWGYAAPSIIDALNRIRAPFNVTIAGQKAAMAALEDQKFVHDSYKHNRKWRSWFEDQMALLSNAGIRVIPSAANFSLLLFEGSLTAENAYKALMEEGYTARWLPGQRLPHALRITIGSEKHMRDVARILTDLVRQAL